MDKCGGDGGLLKMDTCPNGSPKKKGQMPEKNKKIQNQNVTKESGNKWRKVGDYKCKR